MEEPKNPTDLLDGLMTKRLEHFKEVSDKYDKLYDYIKPFLQYNEDMQKIASDIKHGILIIPIIDTTIYSSFMVMNKTFMDLIAKDKEMLNKAAKELGLPDELFKGVEGDKNCQ